MRRTITAAAAAILALGVAGCGAAATPKPHQSPTPSARASSSPAASEKVLGLITESGPVTGTPTIDITGLDGSTLATKGLASDSLAALAGGPKGAYFTSGYQLMLLDTHGTVSTLGSVAVAPASNSSAFQLGSGIDALAISPQGNQWAFLSTTTAPNSLLVAQVWLGGTNLTPHLLLNTTETSSSLPAEFPQGFGYSLLGWGRDGVVVAEIPSGVGGAGPFLDYNVDVFFVNPSTGAETPIANVSNCPLSAFTSAGGYGCALLASSGGGDQSIEVGLPGGQVKFFALPSNTIAGNVAFDPTSAKVAYGQVNLNCAGCSGSMAVELAAIQMEVGTIKSGSAHPLGPLGLTPAAWLPDGRIAATQYSVAPDGQSITSAVVLVNSAGTVTSLVSSLDPEFIGLATG